MMSEVGVGGTDDRYNVEVELGVGRTDQTDITSEVGTEVSGTDQTCLRYEWEWVELIRHI